MVAQPDRRHRPAATPEDEGACDRANEVDRWDDEVEHDRAG